MQIRYKYFFYGFLFGLMFPIGAVTVELLTRELTLSLTNIKLIHSVNVLVYMIDSAPIFLGFFALLGGVSKEKSVKLLNKLLELSEVLKTKNIQLQDNAQHAFTTLKASSENLEQLMQSIHDNNHLINVSRSESKESTIELKNTTEGLINTSSDLLSHSNGLKLRSNQISVDMQDFVQALTKLSDSIKSIASFGTEINILSLNSGIEAHKMGETAKSFSVISKQIKELSDNIAITNKVTHELSGQLTGKIDTLVTDINTQTENIQAIDCISTSIENTVDVCRTHISSVQNKLQHNDELSEAQVEAFHKLKSQLLLVREENEKLTHFLSESINEETAILSDINQLSGK